MARPLRVNIPHSLGKDVARQRLQGGFANARQEMNGAMFGMFSFNERWEADRLHFECGTFGQKVTGRLDVLADAVAIEIDLPELLAALAERVSTLVTRQTKKLLESK